MNLRRWPRAAGAITLALLTGNQRLSAQDAGPAPAQTPAASVKAKLLDDLIAQIETRYVDSIPRDELYDVAARAVVKHLNDRFTGLFAGQAANLWEFGGIGVVVDIRDSIRVTSLFPKSPAAGADVRLGDRIVEIEGKPTTNWTIEQVVNALRGEVGTPVAVTLHRTGRPEPLRITLTRAKIELIAVHPGVMLADSIGYVAFDAITPTSAGELRAQIATLRAKGMRALILDLRANGGGAIDQSVRTADLFLDAGRQIASTRGRSFGTTIEYTDQAKQTWPDLPVIVLVSPRTASGAEIITGALQDNDRALVIGSTTYGKGVGQSQDWLNETTALRLTTLRWYTPAGRNINRATDDTVRSSVAKESSDSAIRARPLAKTVGQRTIRGGRGIVPDLVVQPTAAEWAFIEATDYESDRLPRAIKNVAIDIKAAGTVTKENFLVTRDMREAVYRELQRLGTKVPSKTLKALDPLIDQRLRHDIVQLVFGPEAALQYDPEVSLAAELLQKARTPSALLRLGTSDQGYTVIKQ